MRRYELKDITIKLVDVAAEARLMYGEKFAEELAGEGLLPPTDLRIVVEAGNGTAQTRITFHHGAKLSAEDILNFLHEGR